MVQPAGHCVSHGRDAIQLQRAAVVCPADGHRIGQFPDEASVASAIPEGEHDPPPGAVSDQAPAIQRLVGNADSLGQVEGPEPGLAGQAPDSAARSGFAALAGQLRGQGLPSGVQLAGAPPASRRVTIADVAADAGVGVGTVSRVLNGSDHVRTATLRTVQDSIDRLGYRPNHAASALIRGTPRTVAVVVTRMTGPSVVVRVASALAVLEEQGYDTIICSVDSPQERDRQLEALLPTRRADGVLVIGLPFSREQLALFARTGVALVSVDAAIPGVPQTVINNVAGGRLATDHLIGLGHRRIGFVGATVFARPPAGLGFTASADRLRGYRQALAAAGIGFEASLIRRGPHDAVTAAEHAAQLLKPQDPPSAIFAASDTQAIGVLAAAERLGVPVPEQLSVIGFDDIDTAAVLGLSTVRQPLERSGADGARRLCALLRGERIYPLRQELPVELVSRASTASRASL